MRKTLCSPSLSFIGIKFGSCEGRAAFDPGLTLGNLVGPIRQQLCIYNVIKFTVNVVFLFSVPLLTAIGVVIIFSYLSSRAMEALSKTAEQARYKIAIVRMYKNTSEED